MPLRFRACLLSVCLLFTGLAAAQARFDFAQQATLLPKTVVPSRVQLRLDLDPAQPTFRGDVSITVDVREAAPAVVLHAAKLEAAAATLQGRGPARPLAVAADTATQQWRLTPIDGRPIAAGSYRLRIRYRGEVASTDDGLFLVEHRVAGKPARMLATQLEATSARNVVPGFDEPVFRARFELEVRAPARYSVLSNMPLREKPVSRGGVTRHRFEPTPPMPSYLMAVAVGEFDALASRSGDTPLRIFTAPGKRDQARFAMEVTQQVLPFYTAYFGQPYALPKLDQIAVPGVRQGAMEDWGLISYIENALLFDEAVSDPNTQRTVFSVTAHEIAHQWFGNLVSASSWNEIWLNEAFATWMQDKALAHFHPEWETELYRRIALDRTMQRDATAATRAIRAAPVSESSVFEVFDDITYTKGGAVLTMLEQWAGADSFQRGLAAYMAERAFKPATAGDLWFHVGRAAGLPAAAVAASWTDQKGLPLVEVGARCEQGQTTVDLRQSRFSVGEPLPPSLWQLPVVLARGNERLTVLMTSATQQVRLPGCDERPLVANAGGGGYYRVDYDRESRARLTEAFVTLSPADRLTLLADSFALVYAGRRPINEHLALLARLSRGGDVGPSALFEQALNQWDQLERAFESTPAEAPLRAAGQALFAPELDRLGWQPIAGESSETSRLRAGLVDRLARSRHAATLAAAHQRFAAALAADTTRVPSSLRGGVLRAVGREPSDAEFEALWNALHATTSQEERLLLLEAICAGTDAAKAERLLSESLSGRLPADASLAVLPALSATPSLRPRVYAFAIEHWQALARLGGEGPFGAKNALLPGIAEGSSDRDVAARLLQDQQRLAGEAGASTAERVAAGIQVRALLRERDAASLTDALTHWPPQD